jgi:hypothetical protein
MDDVFDAIWNFGGRGRSEDMLNPAADFVRSKTEFHCCGSRSMHTQRQPNLRSNDFKIARRAWMTSPRSDTSFAK